MPSAVENLAEVRDRLGDLPSRVVDILRQQEPPLPQVPGSDLSQLVPSTVAGAVSQATAELPQPTLPSGPSYEPPVPSEPGFSSLPPVPAPAGMAATTPTMPSAARSDLSLSGPISGQSEVVTLLRQLVDGGGRGAQGAQRPGRQPPSPGRVNWSGSWSADQESYATASPSGDLSNRAGISGASSSRGYASNLRGNRFQQPDAPGATPR